MVCPAKTVRIEQRINAARQMAIPEIKQLDAAPDFPFAQKQWGGSRSLDSHIDVFCDNA